MADTQWPRYEVFKQDKLKRPYEAIGTVHASDGEIALQNARDVHVRRPDCVSLWVVPESAILKMTAQQVAERVHDSKETGNSDGLDRLGGLESQKTTLLSYQIFAKKSLRRSMVAATHVGQVEAPSAERALSLAMENREWSRGPIYVWWIVPDHAIIRSEEDDILSMFEPATRKTYKQQSRYGLPERNAHPFVQSISEDGSDRESP